MYSTSMWWCVCLFELNGIEIKSGVKNEEKQKNEFINFFVLL